MAEVGAAGHTFLLDSICLAANYLRQAVNARRAILVISDCGEDNSRYTEFELLRLLRESGRHLLRHRRGAERAADAGVGVVKAPTP